MPEPDPVKNTSTVVIYKDGKPVEVSVEEFLRMLEKLHD